MGRSRERPLRKDWESAKDAIMHEAVLAKFSQHDDLRETLLGTGDVEIVENRVVHQRVFHRKAPDLGIRVLAWNPSKRGGK